MASGSFLSICGNGSTQEEGFYIKFGKLTEETERERNCTCTIYLNANNRHYFAEKDDFDGHL